VPEWPIVLLELLYPQSAAEEDAGPHVSVTVPDPRPYSGGSDPLADSAADVVADGGADALANDTKPDTLAH
jgi:hypothetical protein